MSAQRGSGPAMVVKRPVKRPLGKRERDQTTKNSRKTNKAVDTARNKSHFKGRTKAPLHHHCYKSHLEITLLAYPLFLSLNLEMFFILHGK